MKHVERKVLLPLIVYQTLLHRVGRENESDDESQKNWTIDREVLSCEHLQPLQERIAHRSINADSWRGYSLTIIIVVIKFWKYIYIWSSIPCWLWNTQTPKRTFFFSLSMHPCSHQPNTSLLDGWWWRRIVCRWELTADRIFVTLSKHQTKSGPIR